jgi:1-deoxy-D-xylulose-5-phosphate synthase
VVNARFAKPIDAGFLADACDGRKLAVTLEDNVTTGGFGNAVYEAMRGAGLDIPVLQFGLPDRYVDHGTIEELLRKVGLSPYDIAKQIRRSLDGP